MLKEKNYILIMAVCALFGFVIAKQIDLQKHVTKVKEPEAANNMAMEVAELTKANQKLRQEVSKLGENHATYSQSAQNQKTVSDAIQKNLIDYKIILGLSKVEGPGILVSFNDKVDSTQLVDLINALKNIGAEAIAINHKRFLPTSSIEQGTFFPPTIVEAIGNSKNLNEALIRKGGIIEQIGTGEVQIQERLIISEK